MTGQSMMLYPKNWMAPFLMMGLVVQVYAGAWPIKPGQGNASLGASYLVAKTVTDGQGQNQEYYVQELGVSTFGETGLIPRLSLNWSWGILKSVESTSMDKVGTTDPELGLTYYLGNQGKWYFSVLVKSRIPLGPDNSATVPNFVYPLFSQQVWAWDARPLLGWSQQDWWMQGGIGPRLRTGGLAPQAGYHFAGGKKLSQDFSAMLALSGILPLDTKSNGSPADREKYLGYQFALSYQIEKYWTGGLQFDSMLNLGQGMPLGLRSNLFVRHAW